MELVSIFDRFCTQDSSFAWELYTAADPPDSSDILIRGELQEMGADGTAGALKYYEATYEALIEFKVKSASDVLDRRRTPNSGELPVLFLLQSVHRREQTSSRTQKHCSLLRLLSGNR